MENITVNCSSIYNIDFSCALFYAIDNPQLSVALFLNEKVGISKNKENRKYISRLAIPLFAWEKDKEDSWKLIHVPLEKLRTLDLFIDTIKKGFSGINDYSVKGGGSFLKGKDSIHTLINELILEFRSTEYSPLAAYIFLIKSIFNNVLKKDDINLECYGQYYEGTCQNNIPKYALIEIVRLIKESCISQKIKFTKGAKISIKEGNEWHDYNCALVTSEILYLSSDRHSHECEIPLALLQGSKFYNIKFRGALELLLFKHFGYPADLAYYIPASFTNTKSGYAEYISPISVSDNNRVSILSGGNGFRLNPSGYSLLDYNLGDNVLNIIRGVFNEKDIEWDDLEEWFYLANNYPRSDEKVSENQNNIQKIITEKEKSIRLKLRKGTIIGDLGFVNVSTLSSIQLGQVLIGQIAFLNHLRESLSPYTMISFHNNVIKYLEDCNFVSNNVFQTSKFIDLFKQLFKYSQALFINIGLNSSKLNQMDLNFQSRLKKISSIKEFEMNLKSSEAYDNYSSLLTIIKLYDLILEEYYTFTVFFLSSALKANILTSTFCFGFEDYFKNINSIIQLREDKKQLYYQPNFFESNGE